MELTQFESENILTSSHLLLAAKIFAQEHLNHLMIDHGKKAKVLHRTQLSEAQQIHHLEKRHPGRIKFYT